MDEALAAQDQQIAGHIEKYGWHCLHVVPCQDDEEHVPPGQWAPVPWQAGYSYIRMDEALTIV